MPLFLPQMYGAETTSSVTDSFFGLNRKLRIGDGEFYDMQNLSSDDAPVMAVRKKRGMPLYEGAKDPRHITVRAAGGLGNYQTVFIDGSTLWIGLVDKVDLAPLGYVASGDKQLIAMAAYIVVLPDMIYVNTADTSDVGKIEEGFRGNGADTSDAVATMTMCDYDGADPQYTQTSAPLFIYDKDSETYKDGNGEVLRTVNGRLWQKLGEGDGLYQYDEEQGQWYKIAAYVKLTVDARYGMLGVIKQLNFAREIKPGDALSFHGLHNAVNGGIENGVHVVVKVFDRTDAVSGIGKAIVVEGTTAVTNLVVEQNATGKEIVVERFIPKMDFVCESGNRLWGCYYGPGADGKLLNEIYCCARGDFFRWGLGLADNEDAPVTFSIGTDGAWTGAINYDGYPTFFKERVMHRVGGYGASGFALYDTPCMGVARGAHKSLAVVGNILYYKSAGAVMGFDGSTPVPVSDALGRLTGYTSAVGGACGGKYYLAINKGGADCHIYVLDTDKGLWHREDGTEIESMATGGDNLWMVSVSRWASDTEEQVTRRILTVEPTPGAIDAEIESEPIRWYAETGVIGLETTDAKYLTKLVLKIRLEAGASVRVSVQYDSSGVWKQIMATETPRIKTVPMSIIPMRCDHMRLRLDGVGDCKVFSITKVFERAEDM